MFPPDELVAVLGGAAAFNCYSPTDEIDDVQWLLNNSTLESNGFEETVTTFFNEGVRIGTLVFTDLPMSYNGTKVGCRVMLSSGLTSASTDATVLLVQGILLFIAELTYAVPAHRKSSVNLVALIRKYSTIKHLCLISNPKINYYSMVNFNL